MNTHASRSFLRDRLPWVIAAVAVIAMGVTMYRSRDAGKAGSDDEAMAQMMARLEALEAGKARGAAQAGATNPAAMGMSPAGAAPMPEGLAGSLGRKPKTPEEIEADREKQLRDLEAKFAVDVKDPVGGGKTENILEKTVTGDTMAGTGLKPNDVEIDCKKNSCRVVGSFAKMGDAQDWGLFYITAAGGNVLSQSQMVFLPQPDGTTQVRIYANRAKP